MAPRSQQQTLTYKRTHSGDPDPETGVFGNRDCMGCVRSWQFDAVIGVGGTGEGVRDGIDEKLTWVGIGAAKQQGEWPDPVVTFDHFLYYGEIGPLLKDMAPNLARRLYSPDGPRILLKDYSPQERFELDRILDLARSAPPSGHHNAPRQSSKGG